jgi:hypothetical protein
MADKLYKPGETAPLSGQYEIVGSRGGNKGGQERTIVQGEPMPPTPASGLRYKMVDPSNNRAGKPKN